MGQVLLIALAAAAASALLAAGVAAGSVLAVPLFYLAPLPVMIAGLAFSPIAAGLAVVFAGIGLGLMFGGTFLVAYVVGMGGPAFALAYAALLARPDAEGRDGLVWFPVGSLVLLAAAPGLSRVAGLRWDAYSQTIRNNRTGAVGENKDSPVDYRFAARYRLTDALTAHASYGQSFVLNSGTGRTGAGFAPEEGKGYEIGLSGAWDNLDLAATVFDIEKTNILTSDPVDPNYLAPVGKLTTRGIELDGSLRVDEAWQVVANYAWTDAKADDAAFASEDVLNVPEHSGSLFVIGRFPTAHGTDWSMTAGAAYVGDRAGTLAADGVRLPAYWKAKAAVEYGLTSQVTARVEVDNLFDERYAASSYSALWIFPGAPRSVRASLRVAL